MLEFCVKKKFFASIHFRPLNTFMRKGKDPEPDPYLWLMDPDPGGPKTCGSCGSGSPTLQPPCPKLGLSPGSVEETHGVLGVLPRVEFHKAESAGGSFELVQSHHNTLHFSALEIWTYRHQCCSRGCRFNWVDYRKTKLVPKY